MANHECVEQENVQVNINYNDPVDGSGKAACSFQVKKLTDDEILMLEKQNSRLVTGYQAAKLERDAKKYWDLFYKRNENRFFKDRHWTTREFEELLGDESFDGNKSLLEIGCGVGNLIFPLVEKGLNWSMYACDISNEAIRLFKENPLYNEETMKSFQADITTDELLNEVPADSVNIATLIFVLSAVHPDKFLRSLKTVYKVTKPGGVILFRDYGLYDMAQLRFKAGCKISENFYMRHDGTRTYYFSLEEVQKLFTDAGFEVICNSYIHRRTVNKKEGIDVPRIFIQAKFCKPDVTAIE